MYSVNKMWYNYIVGINGISPRSDCVAEGANDDENENVFVRGNQTS